MSNDNRHRAGTKQAGVAVGGRFAAEVKTEATGAGLNAGYEHVEQAISEYDQRRRAHYTDEVASLFDDAPDAVASVYELEAPDREAVIAAARKEYDELGGEDLVYHFADDYDSGIDGFANGADHLAWAIPDAEQRDVVEGAYVGAALWTSHDWATGEPLDADYGEEDVSDELRDQMREDLGSFVIGNRPLVNEYLRHEHFRGDSEVAYAQLGHDFWLTRNGEGAGFWDRGLEPLGDKLTEASKTYGGVDLYVGDDGKIRG